MLAALDAMDDAGHTPRLALLERCVARRAVGWGRGAAYWALESGQRIRPGHGGGDCAALLWCGKAALRGCCVDGFVAPGPALPAAVGSLDCPAACRGAGPSGRATARLCAA